MAIKLVALAAVATAVAEVAAAMDEEMVEEV